MLIKADFDDTDRLVSAKIYELAFKDGKAALEISGLSESDELFIWDSTDSVVPLINK